MAGFRVNFHASGKPLDVVAHHVHANSATGDIGDILSRAQTRSEYKLKRLFIGHSAEDVFGDHALLERSRLRLPERFLARLRQPR